MGFLSPEQETQRMASNYDPFIVSENRLDSYRGSVAHDEIIKLRMLAEAQVAKIDWLENRIEILEGKLALNKVQGNRLEFVTNEVKKDSNENT